LTERIAREKNPSPETVHERQRLLAEAFRGLMTKGQKFEQVNEYRRSFFNQVTDRADKVGFHDYPSPYEGDQRVYQGRE